MRGTASLPVAFNLPIFLQSHLRSTNISNPMKYLHEPRRTSKFLTVLRRDSKNHKISRSTKKYIKVPIASKNLVKYAFLELLIYKTSLI